MPAWKIKRLDTDDEHTFSDILDRYPAFDYDQTITRHKLLDGTIKIDREAHLIKEITFAWPMLITRIEREKMEDWAKLACKMLVTWYDEDDHKHEDTGYMILGSSRGVGPFTKYDFTFTLIVTAEA